MDHKAASGKKNPAEKALKKQIHFFFSMCHQLSAWSLRENAVNSQTVQDLKKPSHGPTQTQVAGSECCITSSRQLVSKQAEENRTFKNRKRQLQKYVQQTSDLAHTGEVLGFDWQKLTVICPADLFFFSRCATGFQPGH